MKNYLSARQVVERLGGGISVKLVYALIKKGKLRANRNLGKILIEEDSLIELMEPRAPPEEPPPKKKDRQKVKLDLW